MTGTRLGSSLNEAHENLWGRDPDGRRPAFALGERVLGRMNYIIVGGPLALPPSVTKPTPIATYRAWVDEGTMIVLRWESTMDGRVVIESVATSFEIDPEFAPGTFVRPD